MAEKITRIDIQEFRELGFLQEVNRRVLHPAGLALEVNVAEDGTETLGGVWDYREDREGIYYDADMLSAEKKRSVDELIAAHANARQAMFGHHIQQVPGAPDLGWQASTWDEEAGEESNPPAFAHRDYWVFDDQRKQVIVAYWDGRGWTSYGEEKDDVAVTHWAEFTKPEPPDLEA